MITFIIGFVVGGIFGFGLMACIAGGKDPSDEHRVWDDYEDDDEIDDDEIDEDEDEDEDDVDEEEEEDDE